MRSILTRRLLAVLTTGTAAAALGLTFVGPASARPAQDPVPIEPNQSFSGYINNHPPGTAIIKVACAIGAKTGSPVGDQPVEVKPVTVTSGTDVGFTGSLGHKITAILGPSSTTGTVIATFTSYYVPENIPTTIKVPCSGTGTVFFTPSPTSKTAKSAKLPVKFANIAP